MLEPRPGLEPGTCRFLQAYRGAGSKGLFPHLASRYSTVFGSICSQVVRMLRRQLIWEMESHHGTTPAG
jgi:hypothetical protein